MQWEQMLMPLLTSVNHPKCVQDLKICLKLQVPYYQPLNEWLLGATYPLPFVPPCVSSTHPFIHCAQPAIHSPHPSALCGHLPAQSLHILEALSMNSLCTPPCKPPHTLHASLCHSPCTPLPTTPHNHPCTFHAPSLQ